MRSLSNLYKRVQFVPATVLVGEKDEVIPVRGIEEPNVREEEIEKQRMQIIAEAERQARELLAQAHQEVEAIKKRAREEGWQRGFEEGREAGKKEVQKIFEEKIVLWEKWLSAIRESRREVLENLDEPILEFSFALARKIIGREIEREPFIEALVKRALQKLSNRERVVVRVHRNDYMRIREIKEELLRKIDGLGYLEVQEDPRVEEGGCIVETVFGNIDARIETQLANLREELLKVLSEESHD
jgi:flagellar assembly protein FliH